jgi:hypothetical protein
VTVWVPPGPGWTCPECRFEYGPWTPSTIVEAWAGFGRRYGAPLLKGLPGEDLDVLARTRPAPDVWSALEYACHARDVFRTTSARVDLVMTTDRPTLEPFDPEATAVRDDYAGQDREVVATEIAAVTEAGSERLASLDPADWSRAGVRTGTELTVHWLAVNAIHEGSHHLLDIGRALRTARGR